MTKLIMFVGCKAHDRNVNYTSLLHTHLVYIHTTLTSTTHQKTITIMATPPETTGCSAYNRLDERFNQSFESYGKLCQDGELGKHPGMYVRHQYYDEMKPALNTLQIIFVVESSVQWQPLRHSLEI